MRYISFELQCYVMEKSYFHMKHSGFVYPLSTLHPRLLWMRQHAYTSQKYHDQWLVLVRANLRGRPVILFWWLHAQASRGHSGKTDRYRFLGLLSVFKYQSISLDILDISSSNFSLFIWYVVESRPWRDFSCALVSFQNFWYPVVWDSRELFIFVVFFFQRRVFWQQIRNRFL